MVAIRWGICSAGKISCDFITALKTLPEDEHQVVAIAARSLVNAEELAKKFNVPHTYGTYEELANDKTIDIVYIGSINTKHFTLCSLMINASKNVLCEKPLAMNSKQVKAIISLAKEKKVFLMEAYWSMFFPAYTQLREEIDKGTIGLPRYVSASFGCSHLMSVPRVASRELGGGVILDIGCYCVLFALFVFQRKPTKVLASGFLNEDGIDSSEHVTLIFDHDSIASLHISGICDLENVATVSGTKGFIKVPPYFHCPLELVTPETTHRFPLPITDGETIFPRSRGLIYEAQIVRGCLLRGEKECKLLPHSLSIEIVEIMDEVRKQLGVKFDVD